VNFEWDDEKNRANIKRHGFDFADGWEVFEEPLLVGRDMRIDYGEDRWIAIGSLGNRVVVIVFTEPNEETIRIISLRKATKHERTKLEQTLRNRLG
jgi:uncharacterized DUF497 family protein